MGRTDDADDGIERRADGGAGGSDGTNDRDGQEEGGRGHSDRSGGQRDAPQGGGGDTNYQQGGGTPQGGQGPRQQGGQATGGQGGQAPPQQGGHASRGQGGGQPGGQYQGGQHGGQPPAGQGGYQQGTGLDPNVAAALSYALTWITGIFFLVTEKEDQFVRFHAAQSVVVFGALTVLWVLISVLLPSLLFTGGMGAWYAIGGLFTLVQLAAFGLWVLLMFVAYDGRWFRVPGAAELADSLASNPGQPRGRQPPQQPPQR